MGQSRKARVREEATAFSASMVLIYACSSTLASNMMCYWKAMLIH